MTGDVDTGVARWHESFGDDLGAQKPVSPFSYAYLRDSQRAAKAVLDGLSGLSWAEWRRIGIEADDSARLWAAADPWGDGSADWEAFLPAAAQGPGGPQDPVNVAAVAPAAASAQVARRFVNRDEFEASVRAYLPQTGRQATRGKVLLALAGWDKDRDGRNIFPANESVAKAAGLKSRHDVNRHLNAAEAAGWLARDGKVGNAVKWRLAVPAMLR